MKKQYKIITLKEWRSIHKDYKYSGKHGENKIIVELDKETGATSLQPVKIKESEHFYQPSKQQPYES